MSKRTEQPLAILHTLREDCRSLILATIDANGRPYASPAPFVCDEKGSYHVFVSGLSAHTAHLASGRPVSVLLIQDEMKSPQIFARTRLHQDCQVTEIPREEQTWNILIDAFSFRFGHVMDVLRTLTDFRLFRLEPDEGGRLVTGFGQAFDLKGESLYPVGPSPSRGTEN